MTTVSRRSFLTTSSAAVVVAGSGTAVAPAAAWTRPSDDGLTATYPTTDPSLVRGIVGKAHTDFDGVKALVGSVWEWTNTAFIDEDGAQILKGGSFVDPNALPYLSAVADLWANKKEKTDCIGFRCTKPLENY